MSLPLDSADTIIDCLEHYARAHGEKSAYIFLADGHSQEIHLSYQQLRSRALALSHDLDHHQLAGQRLLLLFPAGLDFIIAFFACLYAGSIAIPANLARNSHHFVRLKNIMTDSGCRAVLTLPTLQQPIATDLCSAGLDLQAITILSEQTGAEQLQPQSKSVKVDADAVAFIQYTSGSTGRPKGVVVTHSQLIANERAIRRTSDLPEFMTGAGWLPQFHDMGLIGNLLQPLAVGGTYVFMSPLHFIQSPLRWIQMLSKYRAFASAAPCFALEMCINAAKGSWDDSWDLSGLDTIFCGAEPISQRTLELFHASFSPCGLGPDAVKPCYGMAETTLIISGGIACKAASFLTVDREALKLGKAVLMTNNRTDSRAVQDIVCCGSAVPEHTIKIVCPESGELCADNVVGEIWCAGPSIAAGYWGNDAATKLTFGAHTACGQGPYLRTGDLGFSNDDGIYVTGRIKEMMIIRGKNHYPHDMEATVAGVFANNNLRVQVVVFAEKESVSDAGVIACVELPRRLNGTPPDSIQKLFPLVRQQISQQHDVLLKNTLLVKYGSIPRTSSGKTQRLLCAELYRSGAIQAHSIS